MSTKDDIKGIALLAVAAISIPIEYVVNKFSVKTDLETIQKYVPKLSSEIDFLIQNQEEISKGITINPDPHATPKSELEMILRNYDMNNIYTKGKTQSGDESWFTSAAYAISSACENYLKKWDINSEKKVLTDKLKQEINNLTDYIHNNKGLDSEKTLSAYRERILAYEQLISTK